MMLKTFHHLPSRHLFAQSQQWKHLNNRWNLPKFNNKDKERRHTSKMESFAKTDNGQKLLLTI